MGELKILNRKKNLSEEQVKIQNTVAFASNVLQQIRQRIKPPHERVKRKLGAKCRI